MRQITRRELQALAAEGAQVVEVLEVVEYRRAHLPGAIHLHLGQLGRRAREVLDPARPVIVYCYDSL